MFELKVRLELWGKGCEWSILMKNDHRRETVQLKKLKNLKKKKNPFLLCIELQTHSTNNL